MDWMRAFLVGWLMGGVSWDEGAEVLWTRCAERWSKGRQIKTKQKL